MIDEGVDAISGNANNAWFGVFEAAESAGIPVITEWVDNSELAPEVIASSVLKSQADFVTEIARDVQEGNFEGKIYITEIVEGSGPAISDTDLLPDEVYNEALDIQAQDRERGARPARRRVVPEPVERAKRTRSAGEQEERGDALGVAMTDGEPIVVLEGITKAYPGVLANDEVTLDLFPRRDPHDPRRERGGQDHA